MHIDKIHDTYLGIAKKLETAGAEAIIICANTPHLVYPFVSPKITIPILHIADATAMSAKEQGLYKLGLLGTKTTMQKDFLQKRITEKHQLEVIVPEQNSHNEIHRIISEELTKGRFNNNAKAFILSEMRKLKDQGAEGIILGCTELPLLLEASDFSLPLLNTTRLHAEMAVEFIFS